MTLIDNFFTKNTLFWGTLRLIIPLLIILAYLYFLYILFYKLPGKMMNGKKDKKKIEI